MSTLLSSGSTLWLEHHRAQNLPSLCVLYWEMLEPKTPFRHHSKPPRPSDDLWAMRRVTFDRNSTDATTGLCRARNNAWSNLWRALRVWCCLRTRQLLLWHPVSHMLQMVSPGLTATVNLTRLRNHLGVTLLRGSGRMLLPSVVSLRRKWVSLRLNKHG